MAYYNSAGDSFNPEDPRSEPQPWQPPEIAPMPAPQPMAPDAGGQPQAAAPEASLWDEMMAQQDEGGGGGGGGAGFDPYSAIQAAPEFSYQQFKAPTVEDMMADPSYQFRLNSGRQAFERSAAARGVLRTGGTLKDLMDYGQNLASQEYGNVYNRAMQSHQMGLQQAKMQYDPRFAQWQAASNLVAPSYGGGGGGGGDYVPPPPEFWDSGDDGSGGGGQDLSGIASPFERMQSKDPYDTSYY